MVANISLLLAAAVFLTCAQDVFSQVKVLSPFGKVGEDLVSELLESSLSMDLGDKVPPPFTALAASPSLTAREDALPHGEWSTRGHSNVPSDARLVRNVQYLGQTLLDDVTGVLGTQGQRDVLASQSTRTTGRSEVEFDVDVSSPGGGASDQDSATSTSYLPCPCNSTASIDSLSCPVPEEVGHARRCHGDGTCTPEGACDCYGRKFWRWPDCKESVLSALTSWRAAIWSLVYLTFGVYFVIKYRKVSAAKRTCLQKGLLVLVAVRIMVGTLQGVLDLSCDVNKDSSVLPIFSSKCNDTMKCIKSCNSVTSMLAISAQLTPFWGAAALAQFWFDMYNNIERLLMRSEPVKRRVYSWSTLLLLSVSTSASLAVQLFGPYRVFESDTEQANNAVKSFESVRDAFLLLTPVVTLVLLGWTYVRSNQVLHRHIDADHVFRRHSTRPPSVPPSSLSSDVLSQVSTRLQRILLLGASISLLIFLLNASELLEYVKRRMELHAVLTLLLLPLLELWLLGCLVQSSMLRHVKKTPIDESSNMLSKEKSWTGEVYSLSPQPSDSSIGSPSKK